MNFPNISSQGAIAMENGKSPPTTAERPFINLIKLD